MRTFLAPATSFQMGRRAAGLVALGLGIAPLFWYFTRPDPPKLLLTMPAPIELVSLNQPRPVYPYSVIAGGVRSPEELSTAMYADPVVGVHYAGIQASNLHLVRLASNETAYVSFRVHDRIFWTARKVALQKDELLLTDGTHTVRARCGNQVSKTAREPARAAPAMDQPEMDQPEAGEESRPRPLANSAPTSATESEAPARVPLQGESDRAALVPAPASAAVKALVAPPPLGAGPLSGIFLVGATSSGAITASSTQPTSPPILSIAPTSIGTYLFPSFATLPSLYGFSPYTNAGQILVPGAPVLFLPGVQPGTPAASSQLGFTLPTLLAVAPVSSTPVFPEPSPPPSFVVTSISAAPSGPANPITPEPSTTLMSLVGLSLLICLGRLRRLFPETPHRGFFVVKELKHRM